MTFGGYDRTRVEGDIVWADTPSKNRTLWGVDLDKVRVGDKGVMGSEGIFSLSDTGTTMILLNRTLFKNVVSMIPNAIVHDFGVKVPREHVGGLQPITFVVKGHNPTLTPDQYMLTQWESHLFNVDPKMANLWFPQHPHPTGAVLGQKFLEKFYSVYD